jgi:hypothetical protein
MSDNVGDQTFQQGILARPMGRVGVVLFLLYFVALSVVALGFLVGAWPNQPQPMQLFGGLISITLPNDGDVRLAIVAMSAGALGAFVHSATSFVTYLGNRQLIRSWTAWYILRPFIGMGLAIMFYLLMRAGFVAPGANPSAINPFGIATVAALAGMFAKESIDKLKEVFDELVKPPKAEDAKRGDKLPDGGSGGGA